MCGKPWKRHWNIFYINDANVCGWRNDHNSIFSCKETAKCFTGLKKGRDPQVDEAVLSFVSKALRKQLPFFMPSDQSEAGEIARLLRIDLTKFKAEGEFTERTAIETSTFYPKLPAGVRQRQW